MKTYFKYICFCLLAIGTYSCDSSDDDLGFEEAGANTLLLDDNISVFDVNEDLTIQLLTDDQEFQSVEVKGADGTTIADAVISGSTATFNTSTLGELTAGENFNISLVSTLTNGQVLSQRFTIAVNDAIALEEAPAAIRFMDTTATALSFSTNTFAAPIDNVSLFRRTNRDTTFVDTGEIFNVESDSINLGEIDYEALGVGVGDTIFYRFEAQSGALNQTVETQVVIDTQDFESNSSTTLSSDSTMISYNLGDAEYTAEGETGDIMFIDPTGFSTREGLDFVKVEVPEDMTAAEFVDGLDLFQAEIEYEAGTKLTSVDTVEAGNVFIYKTTRDGQEFFGTIQIGTVSTTIINGVETRSFDFEFSEGSIIRK